MLLEDSIAVPTQSSRHTALKCRTISSITTIMSQTHQDTRVGMFSKLDSMRRIHQSFPFGKGLSLMILKRFTTLFHSTVGSPNQGFKRILPTFEHGDAVYHELGKMSPISWIEHHELVRSHFVQLLSPTKTRRYVMDDAQIKKWRSEILVFTKTIAASLKRKRKSQDEFQRRAQICIDVLHTMINLLRDNSEDAVLREETLFLVRLCQRAIVLPASFISSGSLKIAPDGAAVDAGASAEVFRGSLDNEEVAIKSFRLYYFTVNKVRKRFIREALILQLARHPNVLRFMSILNEPFKICLITPWYERGHIMKYIAAVPDAPRKELMEQVADGLHFLSQYGIVHRDLKGENVLIDADGKAVIADFGLSVIQECNLPQPSSQVAQDPLVLVIARAQCLEALRMGGLSESATSVSTLAASILSAASSTGGTVPWMAPERLDPTAYGRPTAQATAQSDVYSFGMLVLEVFSGRAPWSPRAECAILLSVIASLRPPRPPDVPDDLWVLVEECWSHLPKDRPTIWEVYNRLACMS
ncbi:kinase-like domain-containing protein [Mycena vulgaris]|nr:kinase-like domain-containing protein [Mycena vulgaris]